MIVSPFNLTLPLVREKFAGLHLSAWDALCSSLAKALLPTFSVSSFYKHTILRGFKQVLAAQKTFPVQSMHRSCAAGFVRSSRRWYIQHVENETQTGFGQAVKRALYAQKCVQENLEYGWRTSENWVCNLRAQFHIRLQSVAYKYGEFGIRRKRVPCNLLRRPLHTSRVGG